MLKFSFNKKLFQLFLGSLYFNGEKARFDLDDDHSDVKMRWACLEIFNLLWKVSSLMWQWHISFSPLIDWLNWSFFISNWKIFKPKQTLLSPPLFCGTSGSDSIPLHRILLPCSSIMMRLTKNELSNFRAAYIRKKRRCSAPPGPGDQLRCFFAASSPWIWSSIALGC